MFAKGGEANSEISCLRMKTDISQIVNVARSYPEFYTPRRSANNLVRAVSLELLRYKRVNPPSFGGVLSPPVKLTGSANSRIMNMIISDVLLTGSQTCPGGVTLHPFPAPALSPALAP